MQSPGIEVRHAQGRYPAGRAVFRSDNIEASVIPLGGHLYAVRLDDHAHPEVWLELTVELNPDPHADKEGDR